MSRPTPILCIILALGWLLACGRERPTFPAADATGSLRVSTVPEGAAIWLDGAETGEVTPATLVGLAPGPHVLHFELAGYRADPESLVVEVVAGTEAQASTDLIEFTPPPEQVVLLESFSNVSCVGCPELAEVVHALDADPDYEDDRVVTVKWSMGWPAPDDPHHLDARTHNVARRDYYQPDLIAIPSVVLNGVFLGSAGSPPEFEAMKSAVTAALAGNPGLRIDIEATPTAVGATADLRVESHRDLDLGNHRLVILLVDLEVEHDSPPGNQGETIFHDVVRDQKIDEDLPSTLDPSTPYVVRRDLTASPVSWSGGRFRVVAFIQRQDTRSILQTGSAVVPRPEEKRQ